MSSNGPYPIALLNELHQWFPDILYNTGRFRNVQDLLEYIQHVASINPYTRGLQEYYARQEDIPRPASRVPPRSSSVPSVSAPAPAPATATAPVSAPIHHMEPIDAAFEYTTVTSVNGRPVTARVRTVPITQAFATFDMEDGMADDNAVVNMINRMLSQPTMQQFLQENVPVVPTPEQIENASSLRVSTQREEDNCAICQDSMEEGQAIRTLTSCNHLFHKICIDSWFRSNVHCPTCRHDIREVRASTPTDE